MKRVSNPYCKICGKVKHDKYINFGRDLRCTCFDCRIKRTHERATKYGGWSLRTYQWEDERYDKRFFEKLGYDCGSYELTRPEIIEATHSLAKFFHIRRPTLKFKKHGGDSFYGHSY